MRYLIHRTLLTAISLIATAIPAWAQETNKKSEAVTPAAAVPQQLVAKVKGRVIDGAGKPVANAEVSRLWFNGRDGKFAPHEPARTAADGSFTSELTFYYGRAYVLATIDTKSGRGGLAVVEPAKAAQPVTIKVGPLVRFHGKYESSDLGKPVGWTNTMVFAMPGRVNFYDFQSMKSQFDFWLPPGNYAIQGYGSSDVAQFKSEFTLSADKTDVDRGAIDLEASKIARLKGKDAPRLLATDARGVGKNTQISDYKGKWVALEFWGYWCGPCVGGALPRMMEIYDDHPDERDQFVILTVHAPDTKTFTDLDPKVYPVVRDTWAGRKLPFPILLDADSKIQQTFGVSHWPTTLLFDPEGKLVGEVQPDDLEAKLKKIPLEVMLPRKLERQVNVYFANPTLKDALASLKTWTQAEYQVDPEALRSLSIAESSKIPLTISGQISLRSALDLLLSPLELTAKVGPKGYVITRTPKPETSAEPALTHVQQTCLTRIERKLRTRSTDFDFNGESLQKVAAFFEEQSGENVVLDPAGRLRGRINPEATITGSGKRAPMGESLEKLIAPLGLRINVRDEVIVLEAK